MTGTSLGGERRNRLKRCLLYGLLIFLAGTMQCGFFSSLTFLPATPDLVLGCLLAIALLDHGKVAMVAAIPAGFFIDAIGGAGIALSPMVYFLITAVMSLLCVKLLPRFPAYALLMLPGAALRALFTLIQLWISLGGLPSVGTLLGILLWEILFTVLFCLPLYGAARLVRIPLVKKSKFSF